jgi:hypothetical protein
MTEFDDHDEACIFAVGRSVEGCVSGVGPAPDLDLAGDMTDAGGRCTLPPPILQVFNLYITVGSVDGERRASAIQFSAQLMALPARLVMVHG